MLRSMTVAAVMVLSVCQAATAAGQQAWHLVEDLRIGSDRSEATSFTDIRGIVAGPQGNIFVLDERAQEIRVFDHSGRFVRLAARRGQGPGEIAGANGLLAYRDTIWTNDFQNGRWSAYSAVDGRFLRQIRLPINAVSLFWAAGIDSEGRFVDPISVPTDRIDPAMNKRVYEQLWRRVRTDGAVVDTLQAFGCPQRSPPRTTSSRSSNGSSPTFVGIPFQARPVSIIDSKGGHWCSPNDEYVLVHRAIVTGDTTHVVRRPYVRRPVSAKERTTAVASVKAALARYRAVNTDYDYSLIPEAHPVFLRLDADDAGRVWARLATGVGNPARFDVYDAGGRHVAALTTSIPFGELPLHIRGDYVYGVVKDQDGVPSVVRARIQRPGS